MTRRPVKFSWYRLAEFALFGVLIGTAVVGVLFGQYLMALLVGMLALNLVSSGIRARTSYRAGWYSGRADLLLAMQEADRRGLTQAEWLAGVAERDTALLADKDWPEQ